MILVVGLGNVGRQYKDTPHNAGFEFVNNLRNELIHKGLLADLWKNENTFQAEICKIREGGEIKYILAKPTTYMNLSGSSVSKLISKYSFDKIVIAHDDLDINLGDFKIQVGRGPKGHNGVISIEKINGSDEFTRVRIGVETRVDKSVITGDKYVIKRMDKSQIETLNEAIYQSIEALNQEIESQVF